MIMRKLLLLAGFFIFTPALLFVTIVFYSYREYLLHSQNKYMRLTTYVHSAITYAALPSTAADFAGGVTAGDIRVEKLNSFFGNYGSKLANYSDDIVGAADKYGLDYTLLPAIAMQESIGCKREIPNTYNCWGWGIYTQKTTVFENYADAINTITKLLAKNYINKGLNTPEEIGKLYNPGNTNDWAGKVSYFMGKIQDQPISTYLTNL